MRFPIQVSYQVSNQLNTLFNCGEQKCYISDPHKTRPRQIRFC